MTTDTEPNDITYDIANILCDLASNYKGDAQSEMLELAERLKTDKEIPDSLREKLICSLEEAYDSLLGKSIGEDNGYSFRFAATTLFDIFKSVNKMKAIAYKSAKSNPKNSLFEDL